MSRAPYQKLSNQGGPAGARGPARPSGSSSSPASSQKSPRESASAENHRQRHAEAEDDEQAPWLTHLEYSVDPLLWDDDMKYKNCPLCNSPFVVSLMGSGKHHCRMCGILCCGACSRGALDLPGYESGDERVCEGCRKRVVALRTFLAKNQETLINNVHVNREAVTFDLYHKGEESYSTEIWLSQSLLLLMYKDRNGSFEGVPIHQIDSIEAGFTTKELLSRKTKTVMCCISTIDETFAAKESCLFSIILTDGRTLDFEASSPSVRNEWMDRLRGLLVHTREFVSYHFEVAQYKVHELVKKEKERLSLNNIKKLITKEKSAARASKNAKSDAIRQKYANKRS